ncbi:MAG: carbohydrate-binding protein [Phycisphaerales bacterium]
MTRPLPARVLALALPAMCAATAGAQSQPLHFTYLWHLEQPIYWPDQQAAGADRYERAWESIVRKDGGALHPTNNLRDIFALADRVAAYQDRIRDSISAISSQPEAGAQISYSGGLIENIASLGNANQLGYSPSWYAGNRTARSWLTSGANPSRRLDIVQFGFHHPLMPLLDDATLRKEIRLYKEVYPDAWGGGGQSRGLFPSEMAFSTRMIGALRAEGIDWVIVSAEKVSRACADFPVVYGSGGINCDPPNRADQINPAQGAGAYYRTAISRGCAPAEAAPYALTPRRARSVNPTTGAVSDIIIIPASQALSWKDGYAPLGTGDFASIQSMAPSGLAPNRPMLIMLAHDGDNAWGGGYSYYLEATPNLVGSAAGQGYVPTVVEKYLADHPVPAGDYVHIEDGAWVNADGDFGAPQFINWNWPLLSASGQIDVENGWHIDARNWAVITAAGNRVQTAEQIATRPAGPQPSGLDTRRILYPDTAGTTAPERAWHYYLASLNSGYMYYGTAEDFEIKPTVACNEAVQHADAVIAAGPALDTTPPSLWTLQRHPWNPGSVNFGPEYGYQQKPAGDNGGGDFYVWTFAYDAAGLGAVTLRWREDLDGQRSLANTENETYAGGPGVGAWQSIPMTRRVFPSGNVYNDPSISFSEAPAYIADEYWARIVGQRSKLLDYYVEAADTLGNLQKSPIHHVYVGAGGGGGGGGATVTLSPAQPVAGQPVTITYNPAGRPLAAAPGVCLHWGINNWTNVPTDPPMVSAGGAWQITLTVPGAATQLDMVFNNCAGTWDNNSGQDWHFPVQGGVPTPTWTMDGARDGASTLVASNGGMNLWAGLIGDVLYVATNDAGEGNDHFIFLADAPGPLTAAPWAKAGQVASWDAYLADENNNDYEGWFDTTATRAAMTGANGGVLEGTINLREELGIASNAPLPDTIALAVAVFPTADGSALVPGAQVPASVNGNTTLDQGEYALVPLCTLRTPTDCPATGGCNDTDFNNDGLFPDTADIDDLLSVFSGGPCSTGGCDPIDFNNDGLSPDTADIDSYLSVFSGGPCL